MRFIILVLSMLTTAVSAQTFWVKGQVSGEIDESNRMIQCADGGFIAVGQRYQAFIEPYVAKFDAEGNIQWERVFQISEDVVLKMDVYTDVVELSDGYLIAASSFNNGSKSARLQKLDFQGELVTELVFQDHEINSLVKTSQNDFYAVMSKNAMDCKIYKHNSLMELEWTEDLPGAKFSPVYGHAYVDDEDHFIFSAKGLYDDELKLYEIDTEGNLIYEHSIEQKENPSRTSLHVQIDENEWVCIPEGKTHNFLQKVNRNTGEVIQTNDISASIESVNEMIKIFEGIYLVGHAKGDPWPSVWVFDFELNLVDSYQLASLIQSNTNATDGASIVDLSATSEGHIAFAGSILTGGFASGFLNGHISRFGELSAVSNQDLIASYNLSVFPNPAQDFVQLSSKSSIESIQIYASNGSLLKSISGSDSNEKIDIDDFAHGSYLIKLVVEEKSVSIPFVKI